MRLNYLYFSTVGAGNLDMVQIFCDIIEVFFDTHTLSGSDVSSEKDVDTGLDDLAIVLNTFDWKKLQSEIGDWSGVHCGDGFRFASVVCSWLHRQLASKCWT